jgi:hypothetical protein
MLSYNLEVLHYAVIVYSNSIYIAILLLAAAINSYCYICRERYRTSGGALKYYCYRSTSESPGTEPADGTLVDSDRGRGRDRNRGRGVTDFISC